MPNAVAVNLEWLFAEVRDGAGDTADRIRAAAAHGVEAVEIWGWRDKDLGRIEAALEETGVELTSLIVDPQLQLTDPAAHDAAVVAVAESLAVAQRLRSPHLVVVAGAARAGVSRDEQHAAVVDVLRRSAAIVEGSGVTLLLEPLNTRVDHVGTYLSSTREGLDIVRETGSDAVRLLLDAYHALVMDEVLEVEIGGDIGLIGHVQVADLPGRHEPGSGVADWARELATLRRLGYTGRWGMEYRPTGGTVASLVAIERIAASIDR